MAKIDKLYKSMGLPMNIKRGNPWPLDVSSVWYSYNEMKAYAEDARGVAYVGQILALVDETNNTAEAYIIADAAGRLSPLGSGVLVDNKTIEIGSNGTIGFKDFGKRFYKYIPEEKDIETGEIIAEATYRLVEVDENNPWKAGLELRVALENDNFVLGWYESNPTTLEGVNNQITAIQNTILDLDKELEKKANSEDVYNKLETQALINEVVSKADHLQRKIVNSYTDIQNFIDEYGKDEASKFIFMVPEEESGVDGHFYEEYIVIDGVIEVIGKWTTDLSDYVTFKALTETLNDYVSTDKLESTLFGYATLTALNALAAEVANKVDKEEGSRLIKQQEIEKLNALRIDAEANYIKAVSSDFIVDINGLLSLNKASLDLTDNITVKALQDEILEINNIVNSNATSINNLNNIIMAQDEAIKNLNLTTSAIEEAQKKNAQDILNISNKAISLEEQLSNLSKSVSSNTSEISNILAGLNNYVMKEDYDREISEIRDILTWKQLEESNGLN